MRVGTKQGTVIRFTIPTFWAAAIREMPAVACYPDDWAAQLQYFLETVVKKPAIVLVQGALLSVALALAKMQQESGSNLIRGLVLAGPFPLGL